MRSLSTAIGLACLAQAGPLWAQSAPASVADCAGVEHLAHTDAGLPRAMAATKNGQLKVVVVGSASSLLGPQAGPDAAYPARLQKALSDRLTSVVVKIAVDARAKRTAANMAAEFERILKDEQPNLVIWQTGTVDAVRGIDPEEFRSTLEEGVQQLRDGGADVILMNMQYSPRTELMIAAEHYLENMRFVALQQEVPLFDRFSIMKQWSELGSFDFATATRDFAQAVRVHDCLGRLLAEMISQAIHATAAAPVTKDMN